MADFNGPTPCVELPFGRRDIAAELREVALGALVLPNRESRQIVVAGGVARVLDPAPYSGEEWIFDKLANGP